MNKLALIYKALEESDRIWKAWHKPDVCIMASRVLQKSLREVGINLEPVIARMDIMNTAMVEVVASGVVNDMNARQREAYLDKVGAWGVGLGQEDKLVKLGFRERAEGRWIGGHMALVNYSDGTFVDPSFGQASRPQKQLELPQSIVTGLRPEVLTGLEAEALDIPNTGILRLQLFPNDKGKWLLSKDWTDHSRSAGLVKRIVKHLKSRK